MDRREIEQYRDALFNRICELTIADQKGEGLSIPTRAKLWSLQQTHKVCCRQLQSTAAVPLDEGERQEIYDIAETVEKFIPVGDAWGESIREEMSSLRIIAERQCGQWRSNPRPRPSC